MADRETKQDRTEEAADRLRTAPDGLTAALEKLPADHPVWSAIRQELTRPAGTTSWGRMLAQRLGVSEDATFGELFATILLGEQGKSHASQD